MMLNELTLWAEKLRIGFSLGQECYKENKVRLPAKITKLFFVGMGGSGIAGKIIKTIFDQQAKIPLFIIDSPVLPAYIDQESLVIVASYSGNTWETVIAFEQLRAKNIPLIILSHGGILRKKATIYGLPFVELPSSLTPRSSLGNTLGFLCGLLEPLGIIAGKRLCDLFCRACDILLAHYVQEQQFEHFLLAATNRSFFYIWGVSNSTDAVAYRAQTQFNENSKIPVVSSVFPELCHNLLVGFTQCESNPLLLVLTLPSTDHLLTKALDITMNLVKERGATLYKPMFLGNTFEEQLLAVILWADFASYFLAKARHIDAQPVHIIDILKERQKQHNIGLE